jgi:hypothetical protein
MTYFLVFFAGFVFAFIFAHAMMAIIGEEE